MDIDELPGHHVDERLVDRHTVHLKCECGWVSAAHADDVHSHKQLHWAAKIIERETLDDLNVEISDTPSSSSRGRHRVPSWRVTNT